MNEPQPTKRKRGRPPKMRPGFKRETPAIKEGASWHVGIPEEEQDELRRKHNETMEKKANVERAIEIDKVIEKSMNLFEPNDIVQLRSEIRMGQFAIVGEAEGDTLHCYLFSQGGIEYLTVKAGECVFVAKPRTGMRLLRYERPVKETAPNWHEEPNK